MYQISLIVIVRQPEYHRFYALIQTLIAPLSRAPWESNIQGWVGGVTSKIWFNYCRISPMTGDYHKSKRPGLEDCVSRTKCNSFHI